MGRSHKDCDHPKTWAARNACRKQDEEYRERGKKRWERVKADPRLLEAKRLRERKWKKQNLRVASAEPEAYAKRMANNAKRRQQQRGTAVEPIIPQQIFKRDNWICHLCGMAVDPSLSHPDPMSASLDHITPLSDGGTHTEDNVACSHLRCNLSKGNRFEVAI